MVSVENHGGSAFAFLHEICGFARYAAAVCFRKDGVPIGYVHIGADDSHDLGYALRSEFWRRGIASEACAAAIAQARAAGIPYLTATHDIDNPRSGAAMRRCGGAGYSINTLIRNSGSRKTFLFLFGCIS